MVFCCKKKFTSEGQRSYKNKNLSACFFTAAAVITIATLCAAGIYFAIRFGDVASHATNNNTVSQPCLPCKNDHLLKHFTTLTQACTVSNTDSLQTNHSTPSPFTTINDVCSSLITPTITTTITITSTTIVGSTNTVVVTATHNIEPTPTP